jgi:hypothetical protein
LTSNSQTKRKINTKALAAIAIIIIIAAAALISWQANFFQPSTSPSPSPSSTPTASIILPPMTLTVIGGDGQQGVLNETGIAALASYTGPSGFKSSGGLIAALGDYTGVPVLTLLDLVGGITSTQTLTVTASDGYSMVYTYSQVNGQDFTTYDPVTGSEASPTQPMVLCVNYFVNGTALPSEEGPLRIGVVGPEGLLTEGHFWTKMTSKLEVTNNIRDWTVTVDSTGNTEPLNMDRQAWTADYNHFTLNWTDSNGNVWTGTALWRWISWYNYNGGISNATLDQGYKVKVISGDGYSAVFDDSQVKLNDNIIVAGKLNGAVLSDPYWPLTIVGSNVTSQETVKNVLQIQVVLDASSASPAATATPSPTVAPTQTPAPTVAPTATPAPTASPSPTPTPVVDYSVVINDTSAVNMTRTAFESQVSSVRVSYTDSTGTVWTGTPLHRIVMWGANNGAISIDALTNGYVVKVIASDGYVATFNDSRIDGNTHIFVANQGNGTALIGNSWPLTLTGSDLTGKEKVKGIAQIQIMPMSRNITLTVVAANGTSVTLFANDLAKMNSYTANGGTRSSSGSLANFGAYTGVQIMDILNLVGITSNNTVKVTASDNYTSTYTYAQLSGTGIATYDSTGATATPTQGLTMIVAYYLNGTSLASNVGPLRTMYVGPDGLYSSGNMNAKMVVKLEIL